MLLGIHTYSKCTCWKYLSSAPAKCIGYLYHNNNAVRSSCDLELNKGSRCLGCSCSGETSACNAGPAIPNGKTKQAAHQPPLCLVVASELFLWALLHFWGARSEGRDTLQLSFSAGASGDKSPYSLAATRNNTNTITWCWNKPWPRLWQQRTPCLLAFGTTGNTLSDCHWCTCKKR